MTVWRVGHLYEQRTKMSTTASATSSTTIDPLWRRALRPLVGRDRRNQVLRALGLKKPAQHAPAKGADAGLRWSRIVMVREMQRMVREIHPENLSALEIAGEDWKNFGFAKFRRT